MLPALGHRFGEAVLSLGQSARALGENVRSIGYSIYYTLVNVGGALGPLCWLPGFISTLRVESVFRVAALSVFPDALRSCLLFPEFKVNARHRRDRIRSRACVAAGNYKLYDRCWESLCNPGSR